MECSVERSERGEGGRSAMPRGKKRPHRTSLVVVVVIDVPYSSFVCIQRDLPNPDHHHFTFFIRLIFRFVNLCEFPQGLSKLHHSTCRLNGGEA